MKKKTTRKPIKVNEVTVGELHLLEQLAALKSQVATLLTKVEELLARPYIQIGGSGKITVPQYPDTTAQPWPTPRPSYTID